MSEITVSKGGKATFSCELPDSSYTGKWKQNGKIMVHDGSRVIITHKATKHTLVITKTTVDDGGQITFNTDKGNVEVPFQLVITEPPSIDPVEFEKSAKELENLKVGGRLILKVPFQGASPIKASWKFNGAAITSSSRCSVVTSATSSTLSLNEFKAEDCGTYEVTLKNKHGELQVPVEVALSDVSEIKFETVTVPGSTVKKTSTMTMQQETVNEITEAPSKPAGSIKFDNMAANRFMIGLTVAPPPDVTQYIVEKCEAGKNDWAEAGTFPTDVKSFVISDLPVGKRYMFRVRASNKFGVSEPLESRAVNVQPPSNPPEMDKNVLEKLKAEQLPKAGKEYKLKIPFVGHPLPIAQWSKDGKKLSSKGRVTSDTTDAATTFSIPNVSAEDSGVYSLLLKNKAGNSTTEFKLTVIDVPSSPLGPIEFELVTGTDATFTWKPPKSDGGRPVTGYEIEKKDMKSSNWLPGVKVGPDETKATVGDLTTGLKYTFRVKAVNQEGGSKPLMSQPVVACGPPGEPSAPKKGKVTANSISLTWDHPANDGGSPVKSYVMEMKEDSGEWEKVPHKVVDNLCASIKNLKEDSAYEFRVAAVNSSGQGRWRKTEKPIHAMDAPEPPIIEEKLKLTLAQPHSCKAGEDVILKVPFTGRPRPTATWQKGGKDMEIKDDDTTKTATVERGEATITLRGVQRSDSGAYKIKLVNSEGESEAELHVVVKDVPTAPRGPIKVLKASSKLITIAWKEPEDDGGTKITHYSVERKEDLPAGEWTRVSKIFAGELLQYVSDHVEKGASYSFRVTAFNQIGHSKSLESEVILADDKYKPPSAPGKPEVTDVTKDSCVLSWTPPNEDGGSPINGFLIELKKQGRRNWTEVNANDLTMNNTGYKVTGLSEGAEYLFRVTAHNEAGNGETGGVSQKVVAIDPIPPPPPITGVKVTDMTDSATSLEWDQPPDLEKYSFNGYVVEMCKEGSTDWRACNDIPIRSNKYRVTGLAPGSRYGFRVRGVNNGGFGNGFATEFMEIRQMQERPKIDIDKSLKETGIEMMANNTVRIVARFTGKPEPTIRWIKDDVNLDTRCNITTQSGLSQMILRNVTKEDSGTYYITAKNSSGKIEIPIKLKVRDTPDPPCNIIIGDLKDDGSLEIRWDPPKQDGGHPIRHYCLQMRDAYCRSFQTVKDKITGTSYTVRDLKPGYTYYFRVLAENELGRGDGHQSNLVTVVQHRGPLQIEKYTHKKFDFQKPAKFNLALKPISLQEHSTARFTCAVGGVPDPEITWYKESLRIKPNSKYSMRNSYGVCTLSVSDCRARDSGIYKCEAKNPSGRATSEASLGIKISH